MQHLVLCELHLVEQGEHRLAVRDERVRTWIDARRRRPRHARTLPSALGDRRFGVREADPAGPPCTNESAVIRGSGRSSIASMPAWPTIPCSVRSYPDDLGPARDHLTGFLIQYWGGPTTYSEQRGHPRLRMRHVSFTIGTAERDAWFGHMAAAVREGGLDVDDETEVLAYFEMAANHLVNTPG